MPILLRSRTRLGVAKAKRVKVDQIQSTIKRKRKVEAKGKAKVAAGKKGKKDEKSSITKTKRPRIPTLAAAKNSQLQKIKKGRSAAAVAGTVDSDIPHTHKHCGLRLDARLAFVEPAINSDKYYILQLLDDAGGVHWVWRRWGRTGHSGQSEINGPLDLAAATAIFNKLFRQKTGVEQAKAVAGTTPVAGKYVWLDTAGDAAQSVGTWEYYVDDGVDGKPTGWCGPAPSPALPTHPGLLAWS